MGKRFSRLRASLRYLQNARNDSNNNPPEGSILKAFADYQNGINRPSYTRDTASKPGSATRVAIRPFAFVNDDMLTVVKMSKRSNTSTNIAIPGACNVKTSVPNDAKGRIGYTPPKAIFFKKDSTQSANTVTSQITGIRYDPIDGKSYTIPFGSTEQKDPISTVRKNITTAVAEPTSTISKVSFRDEMLRNS